jgi:4-hydroxy-2-oxoglutarate aldolase
MNLSVIFAPMPTPFTYGAVDQSAIRSNVARWITAGLGGVLALGTNGEAALLDEDESERVVETVRHEVPRDRVLLAGVGRESTKLTIAATRRAAAAGADGVLVRPPVIYKSRISEQELAAHYRAVADASPIPTLLYNYPALFGVSLGAEFVHRLAEHPNIIGIKETSTDSAQFIELAAGARPGFTVLAGSAPGLYPALCAGAQGAILAVACVLPAACLEIVALTRAGRHDEARAAQQRLMPIAKVVTSGYGIPGLKAAMDLLGYKGGDPRPPLDPVTPEGAEKIRALLAAAGFLKSGS